MTAKMPIAIREAGRRMSSLSRAGCRSTWPRRSPGSPTPPPAQSTATSCESAARTCWERDGDPRAEQSTEHAGAVCADASRRCCPGASLLPFVGDGGGGELPDLELTLAQVRVDPDHLAAYARVCGFSLRDAAARHLPARARVPAAPRADDRHELPVPRGRPGPSRQPHRPAPADPSSRRRWTCESRRRRCKSIPAGARSRSSPRPGSAEELVWEDHSTMLRRGSGSGNGVGGE